jgi:DNA (cytosine-5)-methyltransferase 1
MENVKGLLSATVKQQRMFEGILADLEDPLNAVPDARGEREELSYRIVALANSNRAGTDKFEPHEFLIASERYGVPQTRHRIILVGIRSDIRSAPRLLESQPPVPIEDVIADLPRLRSGLSQEPDSGEAWRGALMTQYVGKSANCCVKSMANSTGAGGVCRGYDAWSGTNVTGLRIRG